MKEKKFRLGDQTAVLVSLCLLLGAGLLALLWPRNDFSEAERRYLISAPSVPSLTAWKTDRETESYLADRVPFRTALVGVDACVQTATGRRTLLETWPVAGAFLEPPVSGTRDKAERRLQQFDALADKAGAEWNVVVPRTHGYLLRNRMNPLLRIQYEKEGEIYGALEADPHFLDVLPEGTDPGEVYYRTDHHWNLQGARLAYEACCREDGLPVYGQEKFEESAYPGFQGTTRSRSGLPAFGSDVLECAEPGGEVTLILPEDGKTYDHLIFPERAKTYDGYAVYLDGNHGILRIENPEAPGGTLLVYKDSFANCLLPLLAADYSRIIAVDARYYAGTFSQAAEEAGKVDRVLFVYSPDSLVNDTAVAGKAGR